MNESYPRRFLLAVAATTILTVGIGIARANPVHQPPTPEAVPVPHNGPSILVPAERPSAGLPGDQIERAPHPAADDVEEPATHVEVPGPAGVTSAPGSDKVSR